MAWARGPETLTVAMAPIPEGVATAQMVSSDKKLVRIFREMIGKDNVFCNFAHMKRYFIHLAYNGARYCGWQIQPQSPSVQGELERCLSLKLGQPVSVTGCGRTDTGVHARCYYAHFDLETPLEDCEELTLRLNAFLPPDIVVFRIFEVPAELHARFDAISRTYHYQIVRGKDPFHQDDAYAYYGPLDVELMQQAADLLRDYTDFTSFSKLHTQVKTNNCKIMEACWLERDGLLVFHIKADRFLRNMVRAIVGTLLEVGKGRMTLDGIRDVIEQKDRCSAGESVPAQGLFLEVVDYDFNFLYNSLTSTK